MSGVSEDITSSSTEAMVSDLAVAKAEAVVWHRPNTIVIGCDSMLEVDGVPHGKPANSEEAVGVWQRLRGSERSLLTGHCVIDAVSSRTAVGVARTTVRFGDPDLTEIRAYVATGEPLRTAGGFTIDGRGAPFVDGVEGDPNNVMGLSVSLLRRLLGQIGISIIDLWAEP